MSECINFKPVRKVAEGVNLGIADEKRNVEKTLSDAFAGMDEALLKVVEANKVVLEKLALSAPPTGASLSLRVRRMATLTLTLVALKASSGNARARQSEVSSLNPCCPVNVAARRQHE